ncbi:MAG: nitroreductase family protein [Promethearchaeota archaeon]
MRFDKSIIEIINQRTSRRTYIPEVLDEDLRERVSKLILLENIKSPFSEVSGECRFEFVSVSEFDPKEKRKLGTYGLIKGAQEFIVGAVEKTKYAKEHFGYLMEYIILGATDLGLGTCWLGGTFNKSLFSSKINIKSNEVVPAITPIGRYPEKRRTIEKVVRKVAKADKRFPWERIFFNGNFNTPLTQNKVKDYETLLEMVRLGPSAGNKQSWRILKDSEKAIFHFYHSEFKGAYTLFPPLDIGIAICHWDLVAEELGIKGNWVFSKPDLINPELTYKISWIGQ